MVILAHHETFLLVLQYILVLSAGAWICFKYLFPMLGRWIVDLNYKMRSNGQRNRQWLKKRSKSMYEKRWIQEEPPEEHFETESQIVKIFSKTLKKGSESMEDLSKTLKKRSDS